MAQGEKKAITKKTNKLEEYHLDFILRKLAEGSYSNQEIADLFNDIYGKEVKITRQGVAYYTSGKCDDRIYDLRKLLSEDITKNFKFANLSTQLAAISKGIEQNIIKNNWKEVNASIELISRLTGKLIEKTEINRTNAMTDEEFRERMRIEKERQKEWLEEYDPEKDEETQDTASA